jgi:hypothetical protein
VPAFAGVLLIDVLPGMVKGLLKELRGHGIAVYFADVHAPVLEHGRKAGLLESIGEDHVFPTVDLAVRHIEAAA